MPNALFVFSRRRVVLTLAAAALLGLFWVRWAVPRVERAAHQRLESTVSRLLGRTVRVERVELHPLLLTGTLHGVRVGGPSAETPLFVSPRWTIHLFPFTPRSSFPWIVPSLGSSRIEEPTLDLRAWGERTAPPSSSGVKPFWWHHRLRWSGGRLRTPQRGNLPSLNLKDVDGEILVLPSGLYVEAEGGALSGALRGKAALSTAGRWEVDLRAENAALERVAALNPAQKDRWRGKSSFRFQAEGNRNPADTDLAWSLTGDVSEGAWLGGPAPVPFSVSFELTPDRFRVKEGRLFGDIRVHGACADPFGEPALDFALEGKAFSLQRFRESLPPEWRRFETAGNGKLEAKITGSPASPAVDLRVALENVSAAGLTVPSLEGFFRHGSDGWSGDVSLLNGRISVSEDADSAGVSRWKIKMDRLDLAQLLPAGRWGSIGGRLSGQTRFKPPEKDGVGLLADGFLRLDRFVWGLHRETHPVVGHFSFANGRFRAKGSENNFHADIRSVDGAMEITEFFLRLPSGLAVDAEGTVKGAEKQLDVNLSVKRAPVKDVPFFVRRYPEIGGTFDFKGRLTGTKEVPVFEGRLGVKRLRAQRDGPVRDATLHVRWEPQRSGTASFEIADEWEGDVRWGPERLESVDLTAKQAAVSFIAGFLPTPTASTGTLDGKLQLATEDAKVPISGDGDLTWSNGRWGLLGFERLRAAFRLDGKSVRLKEWELRQASGTWQAAGELHLSESSKWALRSQFKAFSVGRLVLDGEAIGEGTAQTGPFVLKGEMHSPALWINGYGIGSADAAVRFQEGRLNVGPARLGAGGTAETVVDFRAKSLEGRWTVKDARLSEWAPRFGFKHPVTASGKADADVEWKGEWSSPRVQFHGRWKDASWRNAGFDAEIGGTYSDRRLELTTADVLLAEGGRIDGSGSLMWPKKNGAPAEASPQVDVVFALKGIGSSQTLTFLGFGGRAQGVYDGEFRWSGTLADPVLTGTLGGRDLTVGQARIPEWEADLKYENREIHFDRLFAKTEEGSWTLQSGSRLFLTGPREGHLQLINELRNIHLGPLSFFGGLEIIGRRTGGALGEFNLRAQSLWINQHRFDHDLARVVLAKDRIVFNPAPGAFQQIAGAVRLDRWPQLHLEDLTLHEGNKRRLKINGEVGPHKWDFDLEGWELDAQTLLGLADWSIPMEGRLDVRLRARGSPRRPDVQGRIVGYHGTLARIPYDRMETNITWKGPVLEISGLEAVRKNGFVVRGEGRLPVVGEESPIDDLSLHLRLTDGDLSVLKDVWPECRTAQGKFRGELQILPRGAETQMSGFLILEKGLVKAERYFRELSDLNARLLLLDNRLVFENLSGRFGEGRLVIQGEVGLDGFDIKDYNLSVESVGSKGIEIEAPQLSIPPGPLLKRFSLLRKSLEGVSEGKPFVYLKITGPDGEQTVQGTVVLNDTQFTFPPAAKKRAAATDESWLREFRNETNWDILFKTGEDTWYRNEFVNAKVGGTVRVFGRPGAMRANGRIETQQGVITYLGQAFRVKRAVFEVVSDTRTVLAGDTRVIPYLSGEAERVAPTIDPRGFSTPDTILMVVDRAPIGEIQPRFISRNNPSLSSERVAQMAIGLSAEEFTPAEKDKLLRAGLVQLLGSTAGPLASRIAHRFGIDILYPIYEPEEPGYVAPGQPAAARNRAAQSLLQGAGASAGVQLSDRVFGLYKFKVDETQNQRYFRDEVELIYRVTGNLHLRASTELDTEKFLGQPPNRQAILENQWRFGSPRKRKEDKEAAPSK